MFSAKTTRSTLCPHWAQSPLPICDIVKSSDGDRPNHRASLRYPCLLRAILRWDLPHIEPAPLGEILDISAGGFCLLLAAGREPGRRFAAELIDQTGLSYAQVAATVVHAKPEPTGMWRVGCRVLQPTQS